MFSFYYAASTIRSIAALLSQVIAVRFLGAEIYGEAVVLMALPIYVQAFIGMVFGELTVNVITHDKEGGFIIFK